MKLSRSAVEAAAAAIYIPGWQVYGKKTKARLRLEVEAEMLAALTFDKAAFKSSLRDGTVYEPSPGAVTSAARASGLGPSWDSYGDSTRIQLGRAFARGIRAAAEVETARRSTQNPAHAAAR